MERWAHWCRNGQLIAGYGSVMSKMIANKGVMCFGSGGGKAPVIDCIEADIEAALMQLAVNKPKVVEVVRMHYLAVYYPGINEQSTQFEKSLRMGISLRTYSTRLKQGRDAVIAALGRR
ncbi:hypothetical protein [Photobacterium leiognathi]|uniref:hypothetical protein n=1 Tax=Photobacterium leiognathi TaxID=553611 RepID=UPI0011B1C6CD|nr:hypothetical protein [Photobacterium leiognathi]